MKHIIPTLTLSTLAAASAVAQSAALQTQATPNFSVGVERFDVSSDTLDYDGFTFGAKGKVVGPVSLVASYSDASSDSISLDPVFPGESLDFDVRRYSLGVESSHAVGSGLVAFGIAYADSTLKGSAFGESADLIDNKQVVLSVRYDLEVAKGLTLGFGLTHFINDLKFSNADASDFADFIGLTLEDDDVTAPVLSLSYSPAKAVTLHISYSTEDVALGIPDADGTLTFGVRANF